MTRADHGLPAREVFPQLDRVAAELTDKFHGVFGPAATPARSTRANAI